MQEIQETWVRSPGWDDPLEEDMAMHSSILAWRNPRTGEPCRLQSMGSQKSCTQPSDLALTPLLADIHPPCFPAPHPMLLGKGCCTQPPQGRQHRACLSCLSCVADGWACEWLFSTGSQPGSWLLLSSHTFWKGCLLLTKWAEDSSCLQRHSCLWWILGRKWQGRVAHSCCLEHVVIILSINSTVPGAFVFPATSKLSGSWAGLANP